MGRSQAFGFSGSGAFTRKDPTTGSRLAEVG